MLAAAIVQAIAFLHALLHGVSLVGSNLAIGYGFVNQLNPRILKGLRKGVYTNAELGGNLCE